jgi:6-phosphogluconolactonase
MQSLRRIFTAFTTSLSLLACNAQVQAADAPEAGDVLVYIGTYTGKKSQGIYVSRLNPKTGHMSTPELAGEMTNPSWVTIHPNRKFLFAAGEGGHPGGGAVAGFTIGAEGKLTAINSQPPNGNGPCHLAIDQTGKTIVVSNYGDGSVSSLLIDAEGRLSPSAWVDKHPSLGEKQKPHAHATEFDPSNQFAVSCDAGIDRLYVYRFNALTGLLTPNEPAFITTAADTHPRHLTFSLDGKFCYDIDEHSKSVTAFRFDAKLGSLSQIHTISTLPQGYEGKGGSTAELILHPSGKFLYGSNRGHDSIVAYAIDPTTGKLTLIGHTLTEGKTPRGFGVDPTGGWLIVGNQGSDSVVQFKIDPSTGLLSLTGTKFEVGAPVCFKFLQLK